MEEQIHRKKREKPPVIPHPPGITALDTGVCYFSLLYPLIINRDIHREIFIFKENESGGTTLERLRYSELSGKYKARIKECDGRQRFGFVVLCVLLVISFIFSFKLFSFLMAAALLFTGYEYLDRRVRYLWLKREYYRKRPDAQTEPPGGGEAD